MDIETTIQVKTAVTWMTTAGHWDRLGNRGFRDECLTAAAVHYRKARFEAAAALADRYRAMPIGITS